MRMHCGQCLTPVDSRLGYETPSEEILCGPCYFALWGPRGHDALSPAAGSIRPRSRRPRSRTVWQPGPTGELDPELRLRFAKLRGRPTR